MGISCCKRGPTGQHKSRSATRHQVAHSAEQLRPSEDPHSKGSCYQVTQSDNELGSKNDNCYCYQPFHKSSSSIDIHKHLPTALQASGHDLVMSLGYGNSDFVTKTNLVSTMLSRDMLKDFCNTWWTDLTDVYWYNYCISHCRYQGMLTSDGGNQENRKLMGECVEDMRILEGRLATTYIQARVEQLNEVLYEYFDEDGTDWSDAPIPTGVRDCTFDIVDCLVSHNQCDVGLQTYAIFGEWVSDWARQVVVFILHHNPLGSWVSVMSQLLS